MIAADAQSARATALFDVVFFDLAGTAKVALGRIQAASGAVKGAELFFPADGQVIASRASQPPLALAYLLAEYEARRNLNKELLTP